MMKKDSLFRRTKDYKAEIAIGIAFIFILGSFAAVSVTRTITDSSDTIETYIKNSNGNYWEATGANIQTAIYDFNSTDGHGTVTVPPGTYDLPSGLNITRDKITLFGYGATLQYTSAIQDNFITIGDTASANNITILGFTFDGSNQTVDNSHAEIGIEWTMTGCGIVVNNKNDVGTENTFIRDCYFKDIPNEGIGIHDLLDEGENINTRIDNCIFDHIGFRGVHPHYDHMIMVTNCLFKNMNDSFLTAGVTCEGFEYCIRHGTTITDNTFMNITAGDGVIYGSNSNSLITDNNFYNINSSVTTVIQTWALGEGDSILNNYFCDCQATYTILVNSGSGANIVGNEFVRCAVDNVIRASGNNTAIKVNHFNNLTCSYGIAIFGTQCQVIGNTFVHTDTTDDPSAYIYIDNDCNGNLMITDNSFDRTVMDYWEMIAYHGSYSGTGDMINNNNGHDYSNYLAVPTGTSTPYSSSFAGGLWLDTLNDILHIYDGGYDLTFEANASGGSSAGAPSLARIRNSNNNSWEASASNIAANINKAIDDVYDNSTDGIGKVSVPAGRFLFTEKIIMKDDVSLEGAGMNATILKKSGNAGQLGIWCLGASNFTISNLCVDGGNSYSGSTFTGTASHAISIMNAENYVIQNVKIVNVDGEGITASPDMDVSATFGGYNGTYHNIVVYGMHNADGAGQHCLSFQNCENIDISQCKLYNNSFGLGIDFSGSGADDLHNVTINNVDIWDVAGGLKFIGGVYDVNVNNVNIHNCKHYDGIKFQDDEERINFNNIHIDNVAVGKGIYFNNDCRDISFNNFHVTNILKADASAIQVDIGNIVNNLSFCNGYIDGVNGIGVYFYDADDITITNVKIYNAVSFGNLCLRDTNNVAISNCFFNYGTGSGLRLKGCSNTTVSNCIMKNNGYDGIEIDSSPASDFFIITGCICTDNGQDGISIETAAHDWYIVSKNIVEGNTGTDFVDNGSGANKDVTSNLGA